MGVTKQYLRYSSASVFGIVGSNLCLALSSTKKKLAQVIVNACENVLIWNIKTGEKLLEIPGEEKCVTCLAVDNEQKLLAVGYTNGCIKLFDLDGTHKVTLNGHKSSITSLEFDEKSLRLISGSNDCTLILWDIVNESGLFPLQGHKGPITKCMFYSENIVVSSSKDSFIKFWNLKNQHCFHTLVSHHSEIWDFLFTHSGSHLIVGSTGPELKVFTVEVDNNLNVKTTAIGDLLRNSKGHVAGIIHAYDSQDQTKQYVLVCGSSSDKLDVFNVSSPQQIQKLLKKRQKKLESKGDTNPVQLTPECDDFYRKHGQYKLPGKIRSISCLSLDFVVLYANNKIDSFHLPQDRSSAQQNLESYKSLNRPAHNSDIHTLSFSSDNTAILSASSECLKVWNRASLQCIRTLPCGYALCCMFAPGDRHVFIGTKSGKIQLFDLSASVLLEELDAHEDAVTSFNLYPNKKGFASSSRDNTVKFWDFKLVGDKNKVLSVENSRILKCSEAVLSVCFTPDNKLVAVALTDNTVSVFYVDSLKLFYSLYGHHLPVSCLDASSDSTLIITGSSDKNVKIWSLDFGDCKKSLFAHSDEISSVSMIHGTHMFFSAGKDGTVKQWDADKFVLIQTLKGGHHQAVTAMCTSPNGQFVVSSGQDKCLRLWEKTTEILVLEEEEEMEREKEYEESLYQEQGHLLPDEEESGVQMASKKTVETLKSAEKLMEALELFAEKTKEKDEKNIALHPLFQAYNVVTPHEYFLQMLKMVKSNEIEESLLVMPMSYILDMLPIFRDFLQRGWELELVTRCLLFIVKVNFGQFSNMKTLLPLMEELEDCLSKKLKAYQDMIGFSLAGLKFIQSSVEAKSGTILFKDASEKRKTRKRKLHAILPQ